MNERKRRRKDKALTRLTRLREQLVRDTNEAHGSKVYRDKIIPIIRKLEMEYCESCDYCSGEGIVEDPDTGEVMSCPDCGGSGTTTDLAIDTSGALEEAWEQARKLALEDVDRQIAELSRGPT